MFTIFNLRLAFSNDQTTFNGSYKIYPNERKKTDDNLVHAFLYIILLCSGAGVTKTN